MGWTAAKLVWLVRLSLRLLRAYLEASLAPTTGCVLRLTMSRMYIQLGSYGDSPITGRLLVQDKRARQPGEAYFISWKRDRSETGKKSEI